VLFLTTYGRLGGSSRYLVYNYVEFFERAGLQCTVSPLFDDRYFGFGLLSRPTGFADILRHSGYFVGRVAERLGSLASAARYELVVVEKELLPYFPHGVETVLRRGLRKTVALYDDATHVYYRQHPNGLIRLLCRGKIARVMRASSHVITWNQYLGDYARQHNCNVSVVNTAVDLGRYHVRRHTDQRTGEPVVLGWIGTPNSFPYLCTLEKVFAELAARYDVELRVVSSEPYLSSSIRVVNKRWSVENEVDDLASMDIGLMPLPDDEWTRGKSAAKAVQYMAVAVPAVCSPVGVNCQLVQDGVNGFLASSDEEWTRALARLIESPTLRREIGLRGRETVEAGYSLEVVAPRLIEILRQVAANG
jgi:glycosyltransferase involved in cell wall biosynthesis